MIKVDVGHHQIVVCAILCLIISCSPILVLVAYNFENTILLILVVVVDPTALKLLPRACYAQYAGLREVIGVPFHLAVLVSATIELEGCTTVSTTP